MKSNAKQLETERKERVSQFQAEEDAEEEAMRKRAANNSGGGGSNYHQAAFGVTSHGGQYSSMSQGALHDQLRRKQHKLTRD